MSVTYAVRARTYHGREVFHIGSRGAQGSWPISIFVDRREDAEAIRDAYTAAEHGFITIEERELHVEWAMLGHIDYLIEKEGA